MTGSTPKQQVVIKKEKPAPKPKGTTSKSGSSGTTTLAKPISSAVSSGQSIQVKQERVLPREPKGPPAPRLQISSSGFGEQSNPRGTAGRTESGWVNTMQRGRLMGQGTPSVAPDQAKGVAGIPLNTPQRVATPPRSRSGERSEGAPTQREDTPPRSRSAERSDGRDSGPPSILQPTPIAPSSVGWLNAARPRSLDRDAPSESAATSEGLGPIMFGGSGGQAPDPTPSMDIRSSSLNPLRRAISVLT